MNTILIATDFSAEARNAAIYGVALAREFSAKVILCSAYQPVASPYVETTVIITGDEVKEFTMNQLREEAELINKNLEVQMETLALEGPSGEIILEAARIHQAELIVAGIKKRRTLYRTLFGSTVNDLASKSAIPLLLVPDHVQFVPPDIIALANDSDISFDADIHLLDRVKDFCQHFHSKLYLLRVAKNENSEALELLHRPYNLLRLAKPMEAEYECTEGKEVDEALNRFISSHQVKIIALMPHKHVLLQKLFIKSTTRSMVLHATIPLLILPQPE